MVPAPSTKCCVGLYILGYLVDKCVRLRTFWTTLDRRGLVQYADVLLAAHLSLPRQLDRTRDVAYFVRFIICLVVLFSRFIYVGLLDAVEDTLSDTQLIEMCASLVTGEGFFLYEIFGNCVR